MRLVIPVNTSGGQRKPNQPRGVYHIPLDQQDKTWCGRAIPPRWLRVEADPEAGTITVCGKCQSVQKKSKPLDFRPGQRRRAARSTA